MSRLVPNEKSYWLSKLCETNYAKLRLLIPGLTRLPESLIAHAEGKPSLHLKCLERSPYTLTLELTHCFSLGLGAQLEPAVIIRVYLDACAVEVLNDHERPTVHAALKRQAPAVRVMDYKWRLNYFLSQWLDHCLRCDYRFDESPLEIQVAA